MSKLPPSVQKTVDDAHRVASEAGIKNVPEIHASQNALQAGLTHGSAGDDPPAAEASPAAAPDNVTPIDWERRFRAMKGQYDAEVPRFKAEVENLRTQLAQLQASMQQASPSPPEGTAPAAPSSSERWYSPEQLDEFGQDFFDLVDARVGMVEKTYGEQLGKLVQENETLKTRLTELGQGVQKVQTQPLFSLLDSKVPQWKDLNNDPAFLAWANETPVSEIDDRSMLAAMRILFERGQVDGVARIFKMYLDTLGQGISASTHQSAAPEMPNASPASQPPAMSGSQFVPPEARQSIDMNTLAGPGTSQESGADPLAQQGSSRRWTDTSIAQFYDQVRRGLLQQKDVQALEADLQQAISPQGRRAGRYRPR